MTIQNALKSSACAVILYGVGSFGSAHTQGGQAPFTIRRPPDGATVRENVKIEIPRPSIAPGGFVGIYLDGKFQLALAPEEEEESGKPFTYVWDTKANGISDGEHTLRAVLYEPTAGADTAASEKTSSSVKLTVANKIHDGPTSLMLRYKNHEGEQLEYGREGKSVIVGGVSETGTTTSDQLLADVKSKLDYDVQDVRFDSNYGSEVSLVRNKLTQLSVLQNGQEVTLDPGQLSNSMYQELSPQGAVFYETGTAAGLSEFLALGLPVNNTLELPQLPTGKVQVGDTWNTERQRLDIPGLPPALQPRVTLTNKLEDLEWESGYPTAKIHQSYSGTPQEKQILFGPILITSPKVTFERDIYIAYNSGKLIKTVRTLSVAGRTPSFGAQQGAAPAAGIGGYPGGGPMMPGAGGFPSSGGYPSSGGFGGKSEAGAGPMPGGGGYPNSGGYPSSGGFAAAGAGGFSPRGGGGYPNSGGFASGGGYPTSGGYPGAGGGRTGSLPGHALTIRDIMASRGGGAAGGGTQETDHAVTVKATTETTLLTGVPETNAVVSVSHGASHKSTGKSTKKSGAKSTSKRRP